jgi:general secretion pathway protein C
MLRRFAAIALHLTMLALVCAIGAYWAIRIMTPAPTSAPPPYSGHSAREADPVLAARMFGLVQAAPVQTALNVQAIGVFAAGADSAAVLAVDGKPARVYLLNQEVGGGAKLVAVRKDAVTIERSGVRREIALPVQEALNVGGSPPPPRFAREGNTLSAPTVEGAAQPAAAPLRPLVPRPLPLPRPMPAPPQPQPQPQPSQPDDNQPQAAQQATQPQPVNSTDEVQTGVPIRRGLPNRPESQ